MQSEIHHATDETVASDGLHLFRQTWSLGSPPKAVIVLVHGIGEHGGRYGHLGEFFARNGFRFTATDLRGHGRSQGIRGHIDNWAEFASDLEITIRKARDEHPSLPVFLYGHSLGGLICLDHCQSPACLVDGLICSSPAIGKIGVPPALLLFARLLNRVVPRLRMETHLDAQGLSRDPGIAKALAMDGLSHRYGSVRLSTEVVRRIEAVHRNAERLRLPFLLLLGSADRLVYPERSRVFFGRVPSGRKQLLEYEGAYHELHNDLVKDKVCCDVCEWLNQRIAEFGWRP